MYGIVFVALFAVNVGLAIYLAADAKSHARPWRMFAVGTLTIIVAYGFSQSAEWLNSIGVTANDPILRHLVELTNLICGAMSGALIGTAIANRARRLHSEEFAGLTALRNARASESDDLLEELRKALDFKSHDPGDVELNRRKIEAVERLVHKALEAREDLDAQISRIAP
ncbi:hypothetical protein [Novilysobacter avium]|uniref:Uncharacterized protein n=1 Tax=Novilysobacter avium TaxID=2781023 RepID=A0A7S6ZV88_9GAMM|nr:hypothetical protein [Lysobacter avium]QOW22952.1 hypothetical protein INQ42_05175 [Lysobacter avium]